jgi:hypothetical protein
MSAQLPKITVSTTKPCTRPKCDNDANSSCSRCGIAFYCSKDCQCCHWKIHKKTCAKLDRKSKQGTSTVIYTIGELLQNANLPATRIATLQAIICKICNKFAYGCTCIPNGSNRAQFMEFAADDILVMGSQEDFDNGTLYYTLTDN